MLFIDLDLIKNLEELPEKYIICQDYSQVGENTFTKIELATETFRKITC